MVTHLFKLIWNKKRTHTLLLVEIWASFMVLFGLMVLLIYNLGNYTEPLGFSYDNVWAVNLGNNEDTTGISSKVNRVLQRVKAYPEVESASRMSDNFPFSGYFNGMGVSYNNVTTQVERYVVDDQFAKTLAIPVAAGTWFRNADSIGTYQPLIINRKARERMFGSENPVGKVVSDYEGKKGIWRVIGVVDTFKGRGEFASDKPVMIELLRNSSVYDKTLIIRVKPGTNAQFEARLVHDVVALTNGWSVDVRYLTDSRASLHQQVVVPIVILSIVCGFLLINVALGLFGVLNLSITRRRSEIGLRRAIGATGSGVSTQFVGETWVLATFAILIGLLLAVQFPLLNVFDLQAGVYLTAMGVSVCIIYLIVTLCALFPSRQAALIQPAIALHEE